MTHLFAILALLTPTPPPSVGRQYAPEPPSFLDAVGLARTAPSNSASGRPDQEPAPFAWMNTDAPVSRRRLPFDFGSDDSFQQVLDRVSSPDGMPWTGASLHGVIIDPGRWFYFHEMSAGGLYKRRTRLEIPDPNDIWNAQAGRNWKAQEKLSIPVPVPLPLADQLYLYGQFDGSGDALNNVQTSISGKTAIGMKWGLTSSTELQVRYATLFSYSDPNSLGRFQERAQPAVEVIVSLPKLGPLDVEYFGAAIPAITRTEGDQLRHELRLYIPLQGDNEFEFGARYNRDYSQQTNGSLGDRASLFLGLRLRH